MTCALPPANGKKKGENRAALALLRQRLLLQPLVIAGIIATGDLAILESKARFALEAFPDDRVGLTAECGELLPSSRRHKRRVRETMRHLSASAPSAAGRLRLSVDEAAECGGRP